MDCRETESILRMKPSIVTFLPVMARRLPCAGLPNPVIEPIFTYQDLLEQTNRFANVLRRVGLERGDRVFALLGRTLDLYIAALGTLKAGCVFCLLFFAFGPEPVHARMEIGGATALVTTARLYERKVRALRDRLPDLRTVFLTDGTVEMDSNIVERSIRPIALNRKNALFAGHDEGGRNWGRIASLIETCKLNNVEPYAYLKVTLEAIATGHPAARIADLMPWNFQKSA